MLYLTLPYIVERVWNHTNSKVDDIMTKWNDVSRYGGQNFIESFCDSRWELYNTMLSLMLDAGVPLDMTYWTYFLKDLYKDEVDIEYFDKYNILTLITVVEPLDRKKQIERNGILSQIFKYDIAGNSIDVKAELFDNYIELAKHKIINYEGTYSSIIDSLKSRVDITDTRYARKFASISQLKTKDMVKYAYFQHFNKFYKDFVKLKSSYFILTKDVVIDWIPYLNSLPYIYILADIEKETKRTLSDQEYSDNMFENIKRIESLKFSDDWESRNMDNYKNTNNQIKFNEYNKSGINGIDRDRVQYSKRIDKVAVPMLPTERFYYGEQGGFDYETTSNVFYSKFTHDGNIINMGSSLRSNPNTRQTKNFFNTDRLYQYLDNNSEFGFTSKYK
jgi:hypothetical protein